MFCPLSTAQTVDTVLAGSTPETLTEAHGRGTIARNRTRDPSAPPFPPCPLFKINLSPAPGKLWVFNVFLHLLLPRMLSEWNYTFSSLAPLTQRNAFVIHRVLSFGVLSFS